MSNITVTWLIVIGARYAGNIVASRVGIDGTYYTATAQTHFDQTYLPFTVSGTSKISGTFTGNHTVAMYLYANNNDIYLQNIDDTMWTITAYKV